MTKRVRTKNNISIHLALLDQSIECLRFRVTFQNCAAAKLYFPFPDIIGLHFRNVNTGQEARWLTHMFVSTKGAGFALEPAASRPFEWRVRPCNIDAPNTQQSSDYNRWCVEIPASEYTIVYRFEVGTDYFDPDSHLRLPDLEKMAHNEHASLWIGRADSNSITVVRDRSQ